MNILFITIFFVGFMVSEIPRVSVFGNCPYLVTFPISLYFITKYICLVVGIQMYTHGVRFTCLNPNAP